MMTPRRIGLFLSVTAAGLLMATTAVAGGDKQAKGTKQTKGSRDTASLTTGEIMKSPARHFGKKVSVTAPVGEVIGPQLISLDNPQTGKADLLVLLPRETERTIDANEKLTVTGTLRQFVDADIYVDHDLFTADDALITVWRSAPVLVARSIHTSEGLAVLEPGRGVETRQRAAEVTLGDERGTAAMTAAPGDIVAEPNNYLGKTVKVSADVDEVHSAHVFLLDEDRPFVTKDLIVINPSPVRAPSADAHVVVTGKVRQFVEAEIRSQYGLDLDRELIVELEGRPVLIADSILAERGGNLVQGAMQERQQQQQKRQQQRNREQ